MYGFEALTFNIHGGYLEAIVRGHRSSLLTAADYNNLCQCETLDDIKMHLSATEYGPYLQNGGSPFSLLSSPRSDLMSADGFSPNSRHRIEQFGFFCSLFYDEIGTWRSDFCCVAGFDLLVVMMWIWFSYNLAFLFLWEFCEVQDFWNKRLRLLQFLEFSWPLFSLIGLRRGDWDLCLELGLWEWEDLEFDKWRAFSIWILT